MGAVNRTYRVQVLERSFAVLRLLADSKSGLGLAEISRQSSLNKTTAYRLLGVMEQYRYVERNGSNGQYCLGSKLVELGAKAISGLDLVARARPFLERLVAETGETAHLAVLRGGQVLSLANAESPRTLRTPATVGGRSPAHCTAVGKAILAFSPPAEIDQFISDYGLKKYTKNTITRPAAFRSALQRARQNRYAVDDEEFEEGLRCVGTPVWNHSRTVIGAISVTGPAIRLTQDRMPALVSCVVQAGRELSAALGYLEN